MLHRNNNHTEKLGKNHTLINKPDGIKFFHFTLSEKGHEIVLPYEQETNWEKLQDITWDPGRGD